MCMCVCKRTYVCYVWTIKHLYKVFEEGVPKNYMITARLLRPKKNDMKIIMRTLKYSHIFGVQVYPENCLFNMGRRRSKPLIMSRRQFSNDKQVLLLHCAKTSSNLWSLLLSLCGIYCVSPEFVVRNYEIMAKQGSDEQKEETMQASSDI